jgi:hypothetical protein
MPQFNFSEVEAFVYGLFNWQELVGFQIKELKLI